MKKCNVAILLFSMFVTIALGADNRVNNWIRNNTENGWEKSDRHFFTGKITQWATNEALCYETPKFTVVEKSHFEDSHYFVKVPAVKCTSMKNEAASDNDFQIDGDHMFINGIYRDLVFMDQGTSTGVRGLSIYDVLKKEKVYDGDYWGSLNITDGKLVFWSEPIEATKENCPDLSAYPYGGTVIRKVSLDLEDFHVQKTTETQCVFHS